MHKFVHLEMSEKGDGISMKLTRKMKQKLIIALSLAVLTVVGYNLFIDSDKEIIAQQKIDEMTNSAIGLEDISEEELKEDLKTLETDIN